MSKRTQISNYGGLAQRGLTVDVVVQALVEKGAVNMKKRDVVFQCNWKAKEW